MSISKSIKKPFAIWLIQWSNNDFVWVLFGNHSWLKWCQTCTIRAYMLYYTFLWINEGKYVEKRLNFFNQKTYIKTAYCIVSCVRVCAGHSIRVKPIHSYLLLNIVLSPSSFVCFITTFFLGILHIYNVQHKSHYWIHWYQAVFTLYFNALSDI